MIQNTVIVGMGALGLLFGKQIRDRAGAQAVAFLMGEERKARHERDRYLVNGEEVSFRMLTPAEISGPADLVIIATKGGGLSAAVEMIGGVLGEGTVVISLLNGISSEEEIRKKYPDACVLDCVAIGMDAMREGTALSYTKMGKLQIGSGDEGREHAVRLLADFFQRCGIPYEVCQDIQKAMWNKFMINVGINQTCMVYSATYGEALNTPAWFEEMKGAMREVIALARAEGIALGQEDFENDIRLLKTLNPDSCPSMQQDALAGRKTEADLFAGTVLRLAEKHRIPVPVNEKYLRRIREIESGFAAKPTP